MQCVQLRAAVAQHLGTPDFLRNRVKNESGAVRKAVGGGCQSGWGRLLRVTNAIEVAVRGAAAGQKLGTLGGGGGLDRCGGLGLPEPGFPCPDTRPPHDPSALRHTAHAASCLGSLFYHSSENFRKIVPKKWRLNSVPCPSHRVCPSAAGPLPPPRLGAQRRLQTPRGVLRRFRHQRLCRTPPFMKRAQGLAQVPGCTARPCVDVRTRIPPPALGPYALEYHRPPWSHAHCHRGNATGRAVPRGGGGLGGFLEPGQQDSNPLHTRT